MSAVEKVRENLLGPEPRSLGDDEVLELCAEIDRMRDGVSDAIAEVVYRWGRFERATTRVEEAERLVALSNAMFDLSTWHPDFDGDAGEIATLYEA